MKNGKWKNGSYFGQAIPNIAFASPFSILHFFPSYLGAFVARNPDVSIMSGHRD